MDSIQKLFSDVEKIKKHVRKAAPTAYDCMAVCTQIKENFARSNPSLSSLAGSFADYWIETYIRPSAAPQDEPTDEHIKVLGAMQSLLEGSTDFTDVLTDADWKELCSLTNYEAEDMPLDALNSMMMIFVDKQAWK